MDTNNDKPTETVSAADATVNDNASAPAAAITEVQVNITGAVIKTVTVPVNSTVKQAFEKAGVDPSGYNLRGTDNRPVSLQRTLQASGLIVNAMPKTSVPSGSTSATPPAAAADPAPAVATATVATTPKARHG